MSHAHRGALAIAIVASIATSAPPPAWYAAQQVEMTSITLNDEENIYPLEVHLNADDALLSGDVYYNTQKLTLNVENYIHASTNISLWQLDAPWDGGDLPESAELLSEGWARGAIADQPGEDKVYLSLTLVMDAPTHLVLVGEPVMDLGLDLSIDATLYVEMESQQEMPTGTSFSLEVF